MPASSLLTLIDDIASTLDDIAVMTKLATKKAAGVLGDDLALNAQQVTGVLTEREIPVVWAVAKGSALNKLILVPVALAISEFLPSLIIPLLMAGGLFLCFEGFEKIYEKLTHALKSSNGAEPVDAAADRLEQKKVEQKLQSQEEFETERVKGAVRTDFILSAEIIVISLGTVVGASLVQKIGVLVGISIVMTVGVYGLVAMIVKLDDLGLYLNNPRHSKAKQHLGAGILAFGFIQANLFRHTIALALQFLHCGFGAAQFRIKG